MSVTLVHCLMSLPYILICRSTLVPALCCTHLNLHPLQLLMTRFEIMCILVTLNFRTVEVKSGRLKMLAVVSCYTSLHQMTNQFVSISCYIPSLCLESLIRPHENYNQIKPQVYFDFLWISCTVLCSKEIHEQRLLIDPQTRPTSNISSKWITDRS